MLKHRPSDALARASSRFHCLFFFDTAPDGTAVSAPLAFRNPLAFSGFLRMNSKKLNKRLPANICRSQGLRVTRATDFPFITSTVLNINDSLDVEQPSPNPITTFFRQVDAPLNTPQMMLPAVVLMSTR